MHHWLLVIFAGKSLDRVQRIKTQQSYEFNLVPILTDEQFTAFVPGNVAPRDLEQNFFAQELLIRSGILSRRPTVPNPRNHLHPHDLIATVHVDHLTGDRGSTIARQKDARRAELGRLATAFQRRAFLIMF